MTSMPFPAATSAAPAPDDVPFCAHIVRLIDVADKLAQLVLSDGA